jgi:hypothetical protein
LGIKTKLKKGLLLFGNFLGYLAKIRLQISPAAQIYAAAFCICGRNFCQLAKLFPSIPSTQLVNSVN